LNLKIQKYLSKYAFFVFSYKNFRLVKRNV
jgi:hypothetical protein